MHELMPSEGFLLLLLFIYLLFIWLRRVLVAAHRIFVVARGPERAGLVAPRHVGS